MKVQKIRDGLWRWTVPHPDWTPDKAGPEGWDRDVASVYYEAPGAVVLVDPLVPPDGTRDGDKFWNALDGDVARLGRPVEVLITCRWHGRSADRIRERYRGTAGCTVRAHEDAVAEVKAQIDETFVGDGRNVIEGVVAYDADGADPGEVLFWIPGHRALVAGDVLLGASGDAPARVCPPKWLPEGEAGHRRLVACLRELADLPVEVLLPAHGEFGDMPAVR